jgi:hypothetical protein
MLRLDSSATFSPGLQCRHSTPEMLNLPAVHNSQYIRLELACEPAGQGEHMPSTPARPLWHAMHDNSGSTSVPNQRVIFVTAVLLVALGMSAIHEPEPASELGALVLGDVPLGHLLHTPPIPAYCGEQGWHATPYFTSVPSGHCLHVFVSVSSRLPREHVSGAHEDLVGLGRVPSAHASHSPSMPACPGGHGTHAPLLAEGCMP